MAQYEHHHFVCLGGNENTLAVARYAHRCGSGAMYFDVTKTSAAFSRYVEYMPLMSSTGTEILSRLTITRKRLQEKTPLIFFNSDPFVRFALNFRQDLEKEFTFLIPSRKIIECALDKKRMPEIFPHHLLPEEYPIESSKDLDRLPLPVIVKPRDTSFGLPFKTKVLESRQQIEDFAERFGEELDGFLFQEIVTRRPGRLVSIFFYRRPDGRLHTIAIERERMNPFWGGVGCLIKKTEFLHDRLLAEALKEADYEGLGEVDVFETENSMIMFDLNVRLPGWAFFAEICGVDLLGMYLDDMSKGSLRAFHPRTPCRKSVIKAVDLLNDTEAVFHPRNGLIANGKLTVGQYLKSLKGVRGAYLIDSRDMGPFLHKFYDELRTFLRKRLKIDG